MTKDIDQKNGLVRSRSEARALGEKKYFSGQPCKHGHIDFRYTESGICLECHRIKARRKRDENPEAANRKTQEWRAKNKEHLREYAKQRRTENPELIKRAWESWHAKNKDEHNAKRRAKRAANPEPHRQRVRDWKDRNPEKYKESYQKSTERARSTPKGRLEHAISSGLRRGIKKGSKAGQKTFDILGYTTEELIAHIEKQFVGGMSWDNYGEWHIDHIIPLSAFNYETPHDIDFQRAWSLQNLQPLWGTDNLSKGPKLTHDFQPSLALAVAQTTLTPT